QPDRSGPAGDGPDDWVAVDVGGGAAFPCSPRRASRSPSVPSDAFGPVLSSEAPRPEAGGRAFVMRSAGRRDSRSARAAAPPRRGPRAPPQLPSYLKLTFTFARYARILPFSSCMSSSEISAIRRSRSVFDALVTAAAAAFSHESGLVPTN